MAHISTTTVTAFTLALEAAYATSVGDLQRSTVASVEGGRQYDLRLFGSNVTSEPGLLQVFMDNQWGWVYPDASKSMVAKVACQQMGYLEYSTTVFPTNIGVELQPSTPWLMARVKCSGYESRLVDCAHVNYTSTLPPGVQKLQMWLMCVGVAASGNDSVQVWLNGTSSTGLLQIKKFPYEGWLPFCGTNIDLLAAHVICRQLGHTQALTISLESRVVTPRRPSHVVRFIACQGFEKSLSECTVLVQVSTPTCQRMRVDINLACSDTPLLPLGSEVKLDHENRVQVRYLGFWSYLTSDGPVVSDAVAICRQYGGLNLSKALTTEVPNLSPVLPFRFLCSRGNEASLMECIPVKIPPGSSHSSILHVQCNDKTAPEFGALRLVPNQQFPNKGRIEIYGNHSQWGTICDDYWTDEAATVACKQLGLGNVGISRGNAYYGSGDGPILLDDVQCGGDEEKLLQCDSSPLGEHNCVHGEDAGVECYEQMPTVAPNKEWKVSLVGGPGPYSGTIQLQINDQLGTICDDHFGLSDGLVICKMLGYPFVVRVHVSAKFGIGEGDILLDDLQCTGTESSLENCRFAPLGTHNCMHHEDAGVTCSSDHEYSGPARWTETPLVSIPTGGGGLSANGLNLGIGSATILITLLVVMCVGCMFCACIMRRLRVNSNIETINNNQDNSYSLVTQRENTPASANSVPPSYTDVLTHPNEYSQVNHTDDPALPPQSPPPNSPPPSYARTFQVGNNTLRVITVSDPSSQGEQRVRREPIPIPLSPPPSYDDAAPVFPSPGDSRSGQALPDVVTVSMEADERSTLREIPEEDEHTTVI